ncbi:hypothetical protein LZ198_05155 [Myxococcus sp. K15C18031901]|uniref:hypothetical protein n=1 Tax=Myxococcus dinghuensis TaxID=2906761 RepID=UPI0020A6EACA|nr:hypothetical protein [Myxococcus dinghuensis]MCP3098265.1 hypothetical protein [Myxococcus dinghuensis]
MPPISRTPSPRPFTTTPSNASRSNASTPSPPTTPVAQSHGTTPGSPTTAHPTPTRFDANAPAHAQRAPSPPPTAEQQAALNARRGSLGYNTRPSTPAHSWGVGQEARTLFNSIRNECPNAQLLHHINQTEHPDIKAGRAAGVCSVMVEHWIGNDNHGDPAGFHDQLANKFDMFVNKQNNYDGAIAHKDHLLGEIDTKMAELDTLRAGKTALEEKAKTQPLSPTEQKELERLGAQSKQTFRDIKGMLAKVQDISDGVLRDQCANLPLKRLAIKAPITGNFAEHLQRQLCLRYTPGDTPVAHDDPEDIQQLGTELANGGDGMPTNGDELYPRDGYYRLSFLPEAGPGHVVGMKVDFDAGEFKLMDPNTGEFKANSFDDLVNLAVVHMNKLGYARDYPKYSLEHMKPTPSQHDT